MRTFVTYLLFAVILLGMAACSTQKHFHLLSFFFDGVAEEQEGVVSDLGENSSTEEDTTQMVLAAKPAHFYHQPYQRKECASCHNVGDLSKMSQNQAQLCSGCHVNYETRFNYRHGPSSGGFCTECHHPHESDRPSLLLEEGNTLCLQCHDPQWQAQSIYHDLLGESSCRVCHDPHGSNNHSILEPGTCLMCHDDPAEKFPVLHGPVASTYCSSCHVEHRKGGDALLKEKGNELCLHCHETARLLDGETHADLQEMNCRDCHQHHGGSDRYLLK